MRKFRKFTVPVLIGIFLLILAACGGDDEANGGTDTPTATTASSASTDASFTFQYVCVNRTLDTCKLVQ